MSAKFLLVVLCLFIGAAGVACGGEPAKKKQAKEVKPPVINPDVDHAILDADGRQVHPTGTTNGTLVGGLRVVVQDGSVHASKSGESKELWSAKSDDDRELAMLGSDDKTFYFAAFDVDANERWTPQSPLRVRRLEPSSGKWLEEFDVSGKPAAKQTESISGILTGKGKLVVLTSITEPGGDFSSGHLVSYRVTCFNGNAARAVWSQTFPSAGDEYSPGVMLWASGRSPEETKPAVKPLSWLGDDVLVCAGAVQDVMCLKGDTGKADWKVERVWEYERGFVGPSVWEHFMHRAGGEEKAKDQKPAEKEKPATRMHYIVGGPVVVESAKKEGHEDRRIFVAVADGPLEYTNYLAECIVYELGGSGLPVSMAHLPRMVQGGQFAVLDDGLVWACQGNTMTKLGVSEFSRGMGMGPGGPDYVSRVEWFRETKPREPEAWLNTEPSGDPIAFSADTCFRVTAGGYVTKADATQFVMPLDIIDLKTGIQRTATLTVPFNGKVPAPKTNFRRAGASMKTFGPYLFAITGLKVEGDRLTVILGMNDWYRMLEFNMDEVLGRKAKQ